MPKFQDLSGQIFGKLTVKSYAGKDNGKSAYVCECSCGIRITTRATNLQRGVVKSCPRCVPLTRENPRSKMWQSLLGPELTEQLISSVYAEMAR